MEQSKWQIEWVLVHLVLQQEKLLVKYMENRLNDMKAWANKALILMRSTLKELILIE